MRFTKEFRGRFPNRLADKYQSYMQAVHPFPLDRDKLYWSGYSEEEAEAMRLLKARGIIPQGHLLQVKLNSIAAKRPFINNNPVCNISMSQYYKGYDWPDVTFTDEQILDQDMRASLLSWCVGAAKHRTIKEAIRSYAQHILSEYHGVNTPGQMYRIWPEIACIMPSLHSQKIMGQKLRSSLPKDWNPEKVEDFRDQPYFDEINQAFMAMSLMELEREDSEYPSVS